MLYSYNNGPLRNGSVVSIARLCVGSKIVYFYESDHAFKTIWRRPCSFHLIKIKACFLKPDRPIFIIVINTSCSGVCYRIYARQKFFNNALAPNGALALFGIFAGVYPVTNARARGIYYYNIYQCIPVDGTTFTYFREGNSAI